MLKYAILFGSFYLSVGISGCNNKSAADVIHPTSENIPKEDSLAAIIRKDDHSAKDQKLLEIKKRLSHLNEIITIGELEGNANEMFGMIERALFHNGNVYVLDSRSNNIRVFDLKGSYSYAIGQGGQGPGEFGVAEDMFIDADKLFVLDRLMKVEIFSFSNVAESFEYDSTFFLESYALSFCGLDSVIAVADIISTRKNLLSLYDWKGTRKKGIGNMYRSDNSSIRTGLSRGLLLCSQKHKMILSAFYFFPYISTYSVEGQLLWTTKIDDFDIQRITEKDQGRTTSYGSASNHPFHSFGSGSLVLISDDYFLAQIRDLTEEPNKLDSYIISLKTGEGIYVNSELPLISSTNDSLLVAISEEPFPGVRVFSY